MLIIDGGNYMTTQLEVLGGEGHDAEAAYAGEDGLDTLPHAVPDIMIMTKNIDDLVEGPPEAVTALSELTHEQWYESVFNSL